MLLKLSLRQRLAASAEQSLRQWDALLIPTTPIPAPRFMEVAADEDYARLNMLLMRNTRVVNVLDACALSLPLRRRAPGEAAGLMLMTGTGRDRGLLDIGEAIEKRLRRDRHGLPSENEEREDINA
jgi:aspartyl-tRNA(Asn)/glutamyl-tRNA(Gln) amidotransferase subunit A